MTENLNNEIQKDYNVNGETTSADNIKIPVSGETAFKLKLSEMDKDIAIAEAKLYELKAQKMDLIHKVNVDIVKQDFLAKKAEAEKIVKA